MLIDSLHLSVDDLRIILLSDLSVFDVALAYILVYVIYKALGRYVYFRPQEHTSKINRTFLVLALLVIGLDLLSSVEAYLPFLPEYRWIFILSSLIILISPLSILVGRTIWKYGRSDNPSLRDWGWNFLPISHDYFKTTVNKSETRGNTSSNWEEEAVQSTHKNLHSDALLNILALLVFITTCVKWTFESYPSYGWHSLVFSVIVLLYISSIFIDRGIFSWIKFLGRKLSH